MFKRLRDFLALSMGISTPGAEPNELKWLQREREEAQKRQAGPEQSPVPPAQRPAGPPNDASR